MQIVLCFLYSLVFAVEAGTLTAGVLTGRASPSVPPSAVQATLSGTVVDSVSRKPVPFSSVALYNAEDKQVMGGIADEEGAFTLSVLLPGKYSLAISSVGYQPKIISNVFLGEAGNPVDLGAISLRADSKVLDEVLITGQRDLIEDKGDRLVYNAEKDISNLGGSAADVLRKVPMLAVDLNGNVQLRGSGNFKIFLNGKPSAMMARNPADALRQLPGSNIKSVEVITSPGAKYDAEGTSGIINIVTLKRFEGFQGSAYSSVGNLYQSVGSSVNLQKNKLGVTATAGLNQYRSIGFTEYYRTNLVNGQPANQLYQRSEQDNTGPGVNLGINLDYDPDSTSRLNLWLSGWGGRTPNNNTLYSQLTSNGGQVLQEFQQDIRIADSYLSGEVNLGYTKSFQKKRVVYKYMTVPYLRARQAVGRYTTTNGTGPELSVLMQYSHTPYRNYYTSDQYTLEDVATYRERSTNLSRSNELTFQSDYTYPFEFRKWTDTTWASLEVGAKVIRRDIGSDYTLDQALDGTTNFQPDPSRSSQFDYMQQVISGYLSLRLIRSGGWILTTGGRMEHTTIDGNFVSTGTTLSQQYRNLIPNLMLSKKILGKHTVRLSYTQRIARPQIGYLNPFVNYSNPQNLTTGNPELDPELSHATELNHSMFVGKGIFLNSALFHRQTNNAIEYLTTVNQQGVSTARPQNIARRTITGLQVSSNAKPIKGMNISGGGTLQRIDSYSPALQQGNKGWIGNLTANVSYRLARDLIVQANGNYNTGRIILQGRTSSWYGYAFSAKKDIMKRKASLTLTVNTPFNRVVRQTSYRDAPTFISEAYSANVTRSVLLSFYWQFGQYRSSNRQTRTITNDDKADIPVRR